MVCRAMLRSERLWAEQGGGTGRSQLNLGCIHSGLAVFGGGLRVGLHCEQVIPVEI